MLSEKCITDEVPFEELPKGWAWARLENLCSVIADGDHQAPPQQSNGIPFLVISDVSSGKLDFSSTRFVSLNYYESLDESRKPNIGDLLLTVTGSFGIPVPVDTEAPFCFQRHIALLRPLSDRPFITIAIAAPSTYGHFKAAATGTAQKTVSLSNLRSTLIPIPPLAEQRRIVERVNQLMPLVEEYGELEDAREELDAALPGRLRKSVLQMAVQGKLVPQDPADEPASVLLERIRGQRRKLVAEKKMKAPRGGESVIFRSSDGRRYEKRIDSKGHESEPTCIEDEIPFEIPEGWEWARLETLGAIVGGGTPKTGVPEFWSNDASGIPWITPADMSSQSSIMVSVVSAGKRFISSVGLEKSSAQLLPIGSVLMSSRAPIGYLGIAANPIATNQGFKSVVLIDIALNRWLICALEALMGSIVKRASGTTFKEISGTEFGRTLIPLPPLEEQSRVIESCKSILAAITNQ